MKRFFLHLKKEDGFALVEVAIALIVMGIVMGVGLPSFLHYLQWQKVRETKEKQDKIIYSVSSFVLQNGFIPLPADPYAKGDTFGVSRVFVENSRHLRGLVPFKTLGLPEDYARDGFKHYFTYIGGAPEKEQVDASNQVSFCGSSPLYSLSVTERRPDGSLSARSEKLSLMNPIVLILISHGESGHGAYYGIEGSMKQLHKTNHVGEDKRQNASNSLHIITRNPSKNPQDFFDDMVTWVSRDNLMAFYGKLPCGTDEGATPRGCVLL